MPATAAPAPPRIEITEDCITIKPSERFPMEVVLTRGEDRTPLAEFICARQDDPAGIRTPGDPAQDDAPYLRVWVESGEVYDLSFPDAEDVADRDDHPPAA